MITCGVIYFKFVEIESYRVLDKIVFFGIPYYVYYRYLQLRFRKDRTLLLDCVTRDTILSFELTVRHVISNNDVFFYCQPTNR